MKLWARRRGFRLEPANQEAQEAIERLPTHTLLQIEVIRPRNAKMTALYWSLCNRVADWLDQDGVDADTIDDYFKLECGVSKLYRAPDGTIRKMPGSIAHGRMDQDKFNTYFEKVVRNVYEVLKVPPALVADLLVKDHADER